LQRVRRLRVAGRDRLAWRAGLCKYACAGHDARAQSAVRGEAAVIAGEMDPGSRDEGGESCEQVMTESRSSASGGLRGRGCTPRPG
jgi:hypothetical protein